MLTYAQLAQVWEYHVHDRVWLASTAAMGEKITLKYGGKKIVENGKEYYLVNPAASFVAPLEFPRGPMPRIETGIAVQYEFSIVGGKPPYRWSLLEGKLPEGLQFQEGHYHGLGNSIPIPGVEVGCDFGSIKCRERLGGILRYYYREAA